MTYYSNMAAETIAANKLMEAIVVAGNKEIINQFTRTVYSNGADLIAGHLGTDESNSTTEQVGLISGGKAPLIVLDYAVESDKKASYSLGVTIADNKLVRVLHKTGGHVTVQVVLNRSDSVSAAVAINDPIYASVTDAGKVSSVKPTTANIEALRFVGYADEIVGVAVTADKVITVRY